ncbi:MAG: RagB/SusD family nutrient uptake outer membrane protein [Bacteroidota bacterium]
MKSQIHQHILTTALFIFSCCNSSCKKELDLAAVDPPVTSITQTNVFASDGTAIGALAGIYTQMSSATTNIFTGNQSLSIYCGLSSDELSLWSGSSSTSLIAYYQNNLRLNGTSYLGSESWSNTYKYVFLCNSAIEQLTSSTSENLTPIVRKQLLGEAKFIRAYIYFYLVNLYGDVPLALTSNYKVNNLLPRTPKVQVWQQIISDLHDVQATLSTSYLDGTLLAVSTDRVRPTAGAANALLARAYLYTGNYAGADSAASAVINNSLYALSPLTGTGSVFSRNSSETIWSIQPQGNGLINTFDAYYFIIPSTGPSSSVAFTNINPTLVNSFESGDARKSKWLGTYGTGTNMVYYPYKYTQNAFGTPTATNQTEYMMMLRLAEQYLIRAEARAQLNNISGAKSDLNAIRTRASLPNTIANDQASMLTAIMHERQVELFTELGQRWFDLKRTGTVDAVMAAQTPLKSNNAVQWNTNQQLYPIFQGDINVNPNLKQNPGY